MSKPRASRTLHVFPEQWANLCDHLVELEGAQVFLKKTPLGVHILGVVGERAWTKVELIGVITSSPLWTESLFEITWHRGDRLRRFHVGK